MVFSPYRLFYFLLLKRAGISTVQASFMYNETAATRKASIYDFFLANTMHDFLYSTCGTKYGGFSSVQVYPKSYCIQHKTKRYSFHSCRLMFIFCQHRQHSFHTAFFLPEFVRRIALSMRIDSHHAILSEKLLHSRKAKRYSFHPYRLMFIFSQRRRHDCHMAFSLPEFVRRIAPPMRTHGR